MHSTSSACQIGLVLRAGTFAAAPSLVLIGLDLVALTVARFGRGRFVGRLKAQRHLLATAVVLLVLGASSAQAIPVTGTAILGLNDGTLNALGSPYEHAGATSQLNDGFYGQGSDTYYDNGFTTNYLPYDYFGLTFSTAVPASARLVVDANMFLFGDGGWFGAKSTVQNPLGSSLVTPSMQVTTDGGTSWTTVGSSSNYLSVLAPVSPGSGTTPHILFETNGAIGAGVDGIRLIGLGGGVAGNGHGFIGVSELTVTAVPEPSSLALAGVAGMLGLGYVARRRRAAR